MEDTKRNDEKLDFQKDNSYDMRRNQANGDERGESGCLGEKSAASNLR